VEIKRREREREKEVEIEREREEKTPIDFVSLFQCKNQADIPESPITSLHTFPPNAN